MPRNLDTSTCPAHPVGHYYITIGRVTFCMDCGKLARARTGQS